MTHRRIFAWLSGLAFAAAAPNALAQDYPSRSVRIVVAFAPGGATDLIARTLAQKLTEAWGQPVVVENKAGASGMVGTESVARAAPDGYTLVLATQTTHATNPSLYAKVPYDPVKDFAPVTLVGATPLALLVHPSVPANSVKELVEYLKRSPGKIAYASGGNGTSQHLSAELFKRLAGVDIIHVPYKGAAPAMQDLLGGQVAMMFDNLPTALPHIKSGKLRGLAVTSEKRSGLAPELPTLAESGMPGYSLATWFALFAPAHTPKAVVDKINADVVKALAAPDVREKLGGAGIDLVGGTPEQLATFLPSEIQKWGQLVRDSGAKAE